MSGRITRRALAQAAAGAALLRVLPAVAQQTYPSRPVRIILPFAAGGVGDITARLVAERLGDKLGQRFIIENQPGPGGIGAARTVLSAPPGGYTLGLVTNGTSISAALYNALPFDPLKDFAPISTFGYFDLVLAANADSPYRTLADFIAAARAAPGKLNFGTIAVGSTAQLGAELFKTAAGIDAQTITYRSSPDVVVGLLRNDVALMLDFYAAMQAPLQQGKIRPLATSGRSRTSYLPDVPTAAEAGVAGYEATSWNGLAARRGTPAQVIDVLNRAVREAVAADDIRMRFRSLGIEAKASTPEELAAVMASDIRKWAAVIDRAGIAKQ